MNIQNVLHIVEDLKIGGLERVVAAIVRGLDANKYNPQVWCLAGGGAVAEELIRAGIPVKILGMCSYHNPLNIIKLSRLLKQSKIDIIHTHGYFGGTFGRLAAILAGTPFIVAHVHTQYYGFKIRNLLVERILSHFTDKIVCVSEATRGFVEEFEGIRKEKTCVIYNGSGPQKGFESQWKINRDSFGFINDDIVVVSVASLVKHKGHRVLIDAIKIVSKKNKNLRLLIVGDGPLKNELETYVSDCHLSSNIIFTGLRKDVFALLNLADLFILPSLEREGLGIALIEAMGMGLPVIGTSLGGIPELIKDKVNGFLVTPGNSNQMADAIQRLIVNTDARKKMGMHARKLYEEKFTVQKMLENIELLYRGLIKADNINAFKAI